MSIQSIPARSSSFAHVLTGQTIRIINTHGNQTVDIWAFSAAPPGPKVSRRRSHHHHHSYDEQARSSPPSPMMTPTLGHQVFGFDYLSAVQTRSAILKLLPMTGDALYDNNREPMLVIAEDTSGGAHNLLISTCDQRRYFQMGAIGPHDNCADNLRLALAAAVREYDHSLRFSGPNHGFSETVHAIQSASALVSTESAWLPDPIKLFMNWPVEEVKNGTGGAFNLEPPICPPGGYVALRAERECVVVMSACPMDMLDMTGYGNVGAEFEVHAANQEAPFAQ